MASIKVVLLNPKRPNADGKHSLAVRITIGRKSVYTSVGHAIKANEWDEDAQRVKKNHKNSQRLNNYILKKLAEANERLLEMQTQKEGVSSKAVKESLKPTVGITFFPQAEAYIENLRLRGKYVQVNAETSRVKRFRDYLQGGDIAFPDITPALLGHYASWLEGTFKIKERSILNNLITIRAVFSQAMKEHPALEKHYPFGKKRGVSLKFPDSMKIGLSIDEVRRIEELDLKPFSPLDHTRNIWLTSFYFAGVRNGDVLQLRWADFNDERLHYAMGKNNKVGSVKISEKAAKILKQYASIKDKTGLIFPDLRKVKDFTDAFELERKTSFANKRLNKYLKEIAALASIDKNLTMHIARHTFGNIAGDKIPIQMLQKLYRHSSITTTIGYQANFIHKDTDEALDAVIGF